MKRALSLSFLLLANMFILAHVFIPHHHHQGDIHVVTAKHTHDGNMPDRHHNDNMYEYWLLTITKERLGNDKQINQSIDFDFGIDLLPCFVTLFSDDTKPQIIGVVEHHPYLLHSYSGFIACSLGLRAPPIC